MQVVNLLRNLLLIALVCTAIFLYGQPENTSEAFRVIEFNFSIKEKGTFKVSQQTVPFVENYYPLDELLELDIFKREFAVWNQHNSAQVELFDSLVHQDMLNQIEKHLLERKSTKLEKHKLYLNKSYLISKQEINQLKDELIPDYTVYEVSWPLFSDDGQFAMIYEEEFCGPECGGATINIFYKDKGSWKLVGILPTMVY